MTLTELAKAIAARARPVEVFDVRSIFGLGGEAIPQVAQWVMTKRDEDEAVKAARVYVSTLAGQDAMNDPDIMVDAKNVEAMFRACRDPKDPSCPIFPGPQWMRDNLTTDQLASLLNAYTEVRRKHGGADWEIDDDHVEALIAACWNARSTEIPEMVLRRVPREVLTSVAVAMACKVIETRAELAAARTADPSTEPEPTG